MSSHLSSTSCLPVTSPPSSPPPNQPQWYPIYTPHIPHIPPPPPKATRREGWWGTVLSSSSFSNFIVTTWKRCHFHVGFQRVFQGLILNDIHGICTNNYHNDRRRSSYCLACYCYPSCGTLPDKWLAYLVHKTPFHRANASGLERGSQRKLAGLPCAESPLVFSLTLEHIGTHWNNIGTRFGPKIGVKNGVSGPKVRRFRVWFRGTWTQSVLRKMWYGHHWFNLRKYYVICQAIRPVFVHFE